MSPLFCSPEKKVMESENPKKRKNRRVEIKLIEDKSELNTAFTKRRQGLFKKATDFCEKFNAQAGVVTFSRSGNLYAKGDPHFDQVLKRYLADPSSSVAMEGAGVETVLGGSGIPEKNMVATLTDMEKRINEALGKGRPAWDVILENLGLSELDEIEAAVKAMRTKIAARANEINLHD